MQRPQHSDIYEGKRGDKVQRIRSMSYCPYPPRKLRVLGTVDPPLEPNPIFLFLSQREVTSSGTYFPQRVYRKLGSWGRKDHDFVRGFGDRRVFRYLGRSSVTDGTQC